MDKEGYYFPHFCTARHDRKIKRMRKILGIEGYGIYFMLLEVLREQTDLKFPLCDIDLLADEFGTSQEKIYAVVEKFDLFIIDEDKFFSVKLIQLMRPYIVMRQQRSLAGKASAKARKQRMLEQPLNECSTSKVKESKVNNILCVGESLKTDLKTKGTELRQTFTKPSVSDVSQYVSELGAKIDASSFIDFYESKGWMVGKNKMKDWKAAVRNWNRNNNQTQTKTSSWDRKI